ncbi:MAG: SUMF1/EgtB/PvdO family nonheme iron enzyme [Bacteroidetes bacterium]|jgi:gliding motility-associated lipoprotein GldJ|nr:SUMF1/EgtB/PvdO family nonheme iron enzyme [Bacteroidota bacterium]
MKGGLPLIKTAFLYALCGALLFGVSCKKQSLGRQYGQWMKDKKGRNEVLRSAPTNMVYIPMGKFVMGELDKVTSGEKNTLPHEMEVEAFYLDRTEVTNRAYLAYLNWLSKMSSDPLDYLYALPDTLCWRRPMSYNEPMVRDYLRHPAFQLYPVVGVSWVQANLYCEWRSARINELDSLGEDSVIVRLPTELEWEYAAMANYGYDATTLVNFKSFSIRQRLGFGRGMMMHNFQRGRGDAGGLAHRPNDAGISPAPVYMYESNDYGLYNMHGNVAEWVADAYSAVTFDEVMETENPGNELYTDSLRDDKNFITPDETFKRVMDSLGIENANQAEPETDITGTILRVYKGGGWSDRAYYLNPGSRRFLPQTAAADYIGFRCASPIPENLKKEKPTTGTEIGDSVAGNGNDTAATDQISDKERKKAEKEARKQQKIKEKEEKRKEKELGDNEGQEEEEG